jgi:hypothetical protein
LISGDLKKETCSAGYPSDPGKRKPPQHAAGVGSVPRMRRIAISAFTRVFDAVRC